MIDEGQVEAGDSLRLLDCPFPHWTIARVNDVTYGLGATTDEDRDALASVAAGAQLAASGRPESLTHASARESES